MLVVFYVQDWFYGINIAFVSSFLSIEAANVFCKEAVVYGYGESAGVRLSARL